MAHYIDLVVVVMVITMIVVIFVMNRMRGWVCRQRCTSYSEFPRLEVNPHYFVLSQVSLYELRYGVLA